MLKSEFGLLVGLRNMSAHGNPMAVQEGFQCASVVKSLIKKLKLDPEGLLKVVVNKVCMKLLEASAKEASDGKYSSGMLTFDIVPPVISIGGRMVPKATFSPGSVAEAKTENRIKGCVVISKQDLREFLRGEKARKIKKAK